MIHLTYSNRTEALLEALATDLHRRRETSHPLEPIRLVVPNRNVETWLKQGLARRTGLAANLEVLYLNRFVSRLLEDSQQKPLLDGRALLDSILSLLLDESALGAQTFEAIESYLLAAGREDAAVDRRRHQLALQLSRLLEEYGYGRPEMMLAWEEGPIFSGSRFEGTESWQRALWLELQQRRPGLISLPKLLEGIASLPLGGGPVYFFGISYVATAFHRILAKLAEDGDLHVYTLNPCREFWEDLETGRETSRRLARVGTQKLEEEEDPFGLEAGGDTPALSLWGRPGRENIRLLNELADCDFHAAFAEAQEGRRTLLQQVQQDILQREPERTVVGEAFDFEGDRSIEILACPGVRREAEAVASRIWALLQADPTLRFHEIAVLVAGGDAETYFTHLTAAFEESYEIPYSLTDVSLSSRSRVAEAAEMLLRLPSGPLPRSEVLRFLTHPSVMARYPEADPEEWVLLVDRLGIILGGDRSDLEGTYLEEDLLSWDQGLRRLALGAFLPGGKAAAAQAIRFGSGDGASSYLPEEGGRHAGELGILLRSLLSDLRFARDAKMNTSDWARFFETLIRTYVLPVEGQEEQELDRCLAAVRKVSELPLDGEGIAFTLAVELASAELAALPGGAGNYLADGVAISTLQPMRAIPFRAVFIAGLGEGQFPSAEKRSEIDLRLAKGRAGDVSARESDQYMFLEALLCAREHLILSYVSRHEQTGEPLPPSPVVEGLKRMLRLGYHEDVEDLVCRIPLRHWEGRREDWLPSPRARGERRVASLRGGAAARVEVSEEWNGLLGVLPLPNQEKAAEERSLSFTRLRGFLECPLQGSVQATFGLQRDEEDLADRPTEPFESDRLQRSSLLKATVFDWLRSQGRRDIEEIYETRRLGQSLAGLGPSGLFGRVERKSHLAALRRWAEEIEDGGLPSIEMIRFGGADEDEVIEDVREPLLLEGHPPIRIRGKTEALLGGDTSLLLLGRTFAPSEKIWKEELRAFLDRVFLSAAGIRCERSHQGWIHSVAEGCPSQRIDFAPISREEAMNFLHGVTDELFSGPHEYFLPWEAVIDWEKSNRKKTLTDCVDAWRGDFRRPSSVYGPIRNVREFPNLPEDEAREVVERRFGLFFEKRLGGAKA